MSYQMTLLLASDGTISELWMGQNVEGRGRGQIRNTTPAVVWMDWGKPTLQLVFVPRYAPRTFHTRSRCLPLQRDIGWHLVKIYPVFTKNKQTTVHCSAQKLTL